MQIVPEASKPKDTISVTVINYSPNYLSANYERALKKACENQFNKIGICVIHEDTAPYNFLLQVRVDSFDTKGRAYEGGKAWSYERKNVKAIVFDYLVRNSMNENYLNWGAENDIYFFNKDKRDTRRSCGMVRYTIRHIPLCNKPY